MGITKISNFLFRIETLLAIFLGFTLLASLLLGVIYRYLVKKPLIWTDELAMFMLVWITFIGGSMGMKMKMAPSISIFTDRLPKSIKKIVQFITYFITLIFIITIIYYSVIWLSSTNIQVQEMTTLPFPKLFVYISVPVSFSFMFIHVSTALVEQLYDLKAR